MKQLSKPSWPIWERLVLRTRVAPTQPQLARVTAESVTKRPPGQLVVWAHLMSAERSPVVKVQPSNQMAADGPEEELLLIEVRTIERFFKWRRAVPRPFWEEEVRRTCSRGMPGAGAVVR